MAAANSIFSLGRIGQIAVTVSDLARSVDFYRDQLGLRLLFQAPPGLAFFDCGGIRLMLTLPEGGSAIANSVIYYKVDDIREAFDALSARGVPFEGEPHLIARMPDHELWMTFLRDPDRNLIGLMSEVPSAR